MHQDPTTIVRLLALHPAQRGIGYVLLENDVLIDWGVRRISFTNAAASRSVFARLKERLRPHLVVIERRQGKAGKKGPVIRGQRAELASAAREHRLKLRQYSLRQMNAVFAHWNANTKEQRAEILIERFPVLADYRPPRRKPWMSEHRNMGIFDALSLAMTHIELEKGQREAIKTILF